MFRESENFSNGPDAAKDGMPDDTVARLGGELLSTPPLAKDAVLSNADKERDGLVQFVSLRRSKHSSSDSNGGHTKHDSSDGGHHHKGRASIHAESPDESYWHRVDAAKTAHKFITEFAPAHHGQDKPPQEPVGPMPLPKQGSFPSIDDMLSASKSLNRIAHPDSKQPDFVGDDIDENAFQDRYAAESTRVGREFGLSKDVMENLVKRIYAFEDGGWGTFDTLTNTPESLVATGKEPERRKFHPSGTAVGYNQLMAAGTWDNVKSHGDEIAARLETMATEQPARAKILLEKASMVRGLQEALEHGPPVHKKGKHVNSDWPKTVRTAVHAINLDGDIGPVLQAHELHNLLRFFKDHNLLDSLKAKAAQDTAKAQIYDTLTPARKQAAVTEVISRVQMADPIPGQPDPTADFEKAKGSLEAKLLALPAGMSDTIKRENLTDKEESIMYSQLLQLRKFGGEFGPMSADARALLDKVTFVYRGGVTGDGLIPAAIELANLGGTGIIEAMLKPDNADLPTTNFFAHNGYVANPTVQRRSADELLMQIDRIMHGPHAKATLPGNIGFTDAFKKVPVQP